MRYLLIILITLVFASSCRFMRSNMMLKTPRDFKFDKLIDSLVGNNYKIAANDIISYRVFANSGFKLIDMATQTNATFRTELDGIVQSDDSIKMPLIGNVKIGGLTTMAAQDTLESRYAEFYVDPYVTLKVTNRRVIVFPGNGGSAKVYPLANNNTSIIEAIAGSGGILEDGKAYRVKLIRNNPDNPGKPLVYLMDLSKIYGITDGRSIAQAGDIIYVEPRYRPVKTFNQEITPILALFTTVLLIIQLTKL